MSEKLAECSAEDLEEIKTESLISCASSSDSGWNSAETTLQGEAVPSADTSKEASSTFKNFVLYLENWPFFFFYSCGF